MNELLFTWFCQFFGSDIGLGWNDEFVSERP